MKSKYQEEWLSHEPVVSIGIGYVKNDVLGIIIGIKGKLNSVERKIPDNIDGVPIILKTVKELRAL